MRTADELYHDPYFRTRLEAAARRERTRVIATFLAGLFKPRAVQSRRAARPRLARQG